MLGATNDVPPTLLALGRVAKAAKDRAVKRTNGEAMHLVDVYRASKRLLRVALPTVEDVLGVLHHAPRGLCADSIVCAVDTWESSAPANPITGEEWQFGDMERIVERDLGLRRGLIREGLLLFGFERDGTEHQARWRYTHDREAATITWEPGGFVACVGAGGRFPRVAAEGFAQPTVLDEATEIMGPPPEGVDMEKLLRMYVVSWVLACPKDWRVIEGPKGPPLTGALPSGPVSVN
jgi:hypothetical protein